VRVVAKHQVQAAAHDADMGVCICSIITSDSIWAASNKPANLLFYST
jgi:hypothetical protein